MPTIVENDKVEVPAGKSIAGADLVITATKAGMYQIECKGAGVAPSICEDKFTDLRLARRAVEQYRIANASKFAKREQKEERIKAIELKNGELDNTIQNEE